MGHVVGGKGLIFSDDNSISSSNSSIPELINDDFLIVSGDDSISINEGSILELIDDNGFDDGEYVRPGGWVGLGGRCDYIFNIRINEVDTIVVDSVVPFKGDNEKPKSK